MPNPSSAFRLTRCDQCDELIEEGDDVFFHDGQKFCEGCASEEDMICDCGNYKNPDFKQCYECSRS